MNDPFGPYRMFGSMVPINNNNHLLVSSKKIKSITCNPKTVTGENIKLNIIETCLSLTILTHTHTHTHTHTLLPAHRSTVSQV